MISKSNVMLIELILAILHPSYIDTIHGVNLVGGAFFKALYNAFGIAVLGD